MNNHCYREAEVYSKHISWQTSLCRASAISAVVGMTTYATFGRCLCVRKKSRWALEKGDCVHIHPTRGDRVWVSIATQCHKVRVFVFGRPALRRLLGEIAIKRLTITRACRDEPGTSTQRQKARLDLLIGPLSLQIWLGCDDPLKSADDREAKHPASFLNGWPSISIFGATAG